MRGAVIPTWVFVSCFALSAPLAHATICHDDPRVVAACYTVRGTLAVHANLRPYLHARKRLLAIATSSETAEAAYLMPDTVWRNLDPSQSIMGEFTVCPFTHEQPGVMGMVCIEDARNTQVTP